MCFLTLKVRDVRLVYVFLFDLSLSHYFIIEKLQQNCTKFRGVSKTQTLKTQTFGWSNTFVVQTVRLSNGRSPLLFNESSQATVSQSSQALQRSWASRYSPPTQHSTLTPLGPLFKMTMICWTRSPSDGLLAEPNFSVGVSTEIAVAVKESSRPVKKPIP